MTSALAPAIYIAVLGACVYVWVDEMVGLGWGLCEVVVVWELGWNWSRVGVGVDLKLEVRVETCCDAKKFRRT